MISPARTSRWELPPRARRIPSTDVLGRVRDGTTSACAENTSENSTVANIWGNYLRVRGEYRRRGHQKAEEAELPPRARRILHLASGAVHGLGTTSACAENTFIWQHQTSLNRNYLRVRGEYRVSPVRGCSHSELPPRARRIRKRRHTMRFLHGTTSACAENTLNELGLL